MYSSLSVTKGQQAVLTRGLGTRHCGRLVYVLRGGQEAEYRKCFCKILRHCVCGFIIQREWSGWCDYTVGKLRGDIQGC